MRLTTTNSKTPSTKIRIMLSGFSVIMRHRARPAHTAALPALQTMAPIQKRLRPSCLVALLPDGCQPRR